MSPLPPDTHPDILEAEAAPAAAAGWIARTRGLLAQLRGAFDAGLDPPSTATAATDAAVRHRRAHRPGLPRKRDADPELRAFVRARIDHITFEALAAAVACAFPPPRRVSTSALHARRKPRLARNPDPAQPRPVPALHASNLLKSQAQII